MDDKPREYSIALFRGPERDGEVPVFKMSMVCDIEKYQAAVDEFINDFYRMQSRVSDEWQVCDHWRVCDGVRKDIDFTFTEQDAISILLYACLAERDNITLKEVCYRDRAYTDISDFDYTSWKDQVTSDVARAISCKLTARDGTCRVTLYCWGPYLIETKATDYRNCQRSLSNGIVEVPGTRTYMGKYRYEKADKGARSGDGADLFTFLDIDGEDLTFSVLIDGKLYKKISRNANRVIFYDTPLDRQRLYSDMFRYGMIGYAFENVDGEYIHGISRDEPGSCVFVPPMAPGAENLDRDSARRLFDGYVKALYDTCSTMKPGEGDFQLGKDGLFHSFDGTHGFAITGKFAAPDLKAVLRDSWDATVQDNLCFEVESVSFTVDGVEVELILKGSSTLEIHVIDSGHDREYRVDFDALNKWGFFASAALPQIPCFDKPYAVFKRYVWLYRNIKGAVVGYGIHKFVADLAEMLETYYGVDRGEMSDGLYGEGMIVDDEVVDFAVEMKNAYNRTDIIPNIALIGEAGTGKTRMAERLAKSAFGKGLLSLSPSDLKGPYIGWTKKEVVRKLIEAVDNNQVFFIDEAYELMSDSFGREAVSLILPLITRNRWKVDADDETGNKERFVLSIDFGKGEVIDNKDGIVRKVKPGIPPIWISGYEDDIRLMLSQNQGLFRRFKRVMLRTPRTEELYKELMHTIPGRLWGNVNRREAVEVKYSILKKQFEANEKMIKKFFQWGAQPQNSKYFASHAGVRRFLDRCLDRIDFSRSESEITRQIEDIIAFEKRDVKRQLDTLRRKGGKDGRNQAAGDDDADRIEIVCDNPARLDHIVGCDAQKEYMRGIIDMFVEKSHFESCNITVPKGALLLGPPGVGKTFIARAMAGQLQEEFEEKAPNQRVGFMSLSGPEIASRPVSFIRSIFDRAEEYDVCVIFVDEVDAIARNRFRNRENYSHLIELIRQMDGMERRTNIFILAATNAHESLDPAFVRSGRIDKKMSFYLPTSDDCREMAKRGIKGRLGAMVNFSPDGNEDGIDRLVGEVARIMQGCTLGDVENVINTGFMMYDQERRLGKRSQPAEHASKPGFGDYELDHLYRNIYEAYERHKFGDPRPSRKEGIFSAAKNNESWSSTSVHEVGHALVRILDGGLFEKITCVPRGGALGYVRTYRSETMTKADYEDDIRFAMGGRAAEEVVYGKDSISGGARSDMEDATQLAREMVERLGFADEFGFMAVGRVVSEHLGKSEYNVSDSFREHADRAVRELLRRLYQETKDMFLNRKDIIVALAEKVFEMESMTGREFKAFYDGLAAKTR